MNDDRYKINFLTGKVTKKRVVKTKPAVEPVADSVAAFADEAE